MQNLQFIFFQLDEARRYIEDGRLPHLRLALLLLDNAAEIQMNRRIQDEWEYDRFNKQLLEYSSKIPEELLTEHLRGLREWVPLNQSEKSRIERVFDEKVKYLVDLGHLEEGMGGPLKYLHRYRNEAYHRAKIRPNTIRTAALISLEINCHMALCMPPGAVSYYSGDDYSWLEERFGYKPFEIMGRPTPTSTVIENIRSSVLPSDQSVSIALADHLNNRISGLDDSLTFIVENLERKLTKEDAFRESQYYCKIARTGETWSPEALARFVPDHSLQWIEGLKSQTVRVVSAMTRIKSFHEFSQIEKALEPIELCVNQMADAIGSAIQAEVDRSRGK
jgi:hypothetical protein